MMFFFIDFFPSFPKTGLGGKNAQFFRIKMLSKFPLKSADPNILDDYERKYRCGSFCVISNHKPEADGENLPFE